MKLLVISHKCCWPSAASPSGFATDGGFPYQMRAMSELFDSTVLAIPAVPNGNPEGSGPLVGRNLSVMPLREPRGKDIWRKAGIIPWFAHSLPVLLREIRRADAVYAGIPGDVGAIGMMLALALRKPLFVRYCGNWEVRYTRAQRFAQAFMERFAGGRNVMLATGGGESPPSRKNPHIHWIFATTLEQRELESCGKLRTLDPERLRLITVCRQERGKGTDRVIESLPFLHAGVTLDVVGEGGAIPELRRLAAALGVSDRVTFHGRVDHAGVLRALQAADLFCYPTASEGFPKAVLEALACGLPVITTPVSVLRLLISRGCGVLLENTSPEEIAATVRRCATDANLYRRMSAKALETAREFSLERWRDSLADLLTKAWGPLAREM